MILNTKRISNFFKYFARDRLLLFQHCFHGKHLEMPKVNKNA